MLIQCQECNGQVSDKAAACPHCGAPVSPPSVAVPTPVRVVKEKSNAWKWIVGVPAAAFAVFMAVGFSIPEYKGRAMEVRKVCESQIIYGRTTQFDCDQMYSKMIWDGEHPNQQSPEALRAAGVTQADVDAALADGKKKAKETTKSSAPLPSPGNLLEGQPQEIQDIVSGMDRQPLKRRP